MIRRFLMILLLAVSIAACDRTSPETKQVEGVVMQYNTLLAEGYKNLNMNPLQLVATEDVATKAYYHMAALGEERVRMISTLRDLKFKEIKFPTPSSARISTRETWDYSHNDIKTGKKMLEEKGFVYEMTYEMKKDGGQWKITNVVAAEGAR